MAMQRRCDVCDQPCDASLTPLGHAAPWYINIKFEVRRWLSKIISEDIDLCWRCFNDYKRFVKKERGVTT